MHFFQSQFFVTGIIYGRHRLVPDQVIAHLAQENAMSAYGFLGMMFLNAFCNEGCRNSIYRTGVEVEAMHGAAITALTMYDMLKPIDKAVEIGTIKLLQKEGGKSGTAGPGMQFTAAVIVCSDTIAKGVGTDISGKLAIDQLKKHGVDTVTYEIIPDEVTAIRSKAEALSTAQIDLILFIGGTGLSPRDVTPEAIAPLINTPIPGIMEAVRHYGQERIPYAMLSRGIAGFMNNSLAITFPGSTNAVQEAMDALFPHILHVFKVRSGFRHSS